MRKSLSFPFLILIIFNHIFAQQIDTTIQHTATIFISSVPPNADVYMDGKFIGKTNVSKLNVLSGTHELKFVKGNQQNVEKMTFNPGDNGILGKLEMLKDRNVSEQEVVAKKNDSLMQYNGKSEASIVSNLEILFWNEWRK